LVNLVMGVRFVDRPEVSLNVLAQDAVLLRLVIEDRVAKVLESIA
jgi:hypothetical protein